MVSEAVEKLKTDWHKWTLGPYKILLQSDIYEKDIEEWEIQMHELTGQKGGSVSARRAPGIFF